MTQTTPSITREECIAWLDERIKHPFAMSTSQEQYVRMAHATRGYLHQPDPPEKSMIRNRISEILVRNGLRTNQVAICELVGLIDQQPAPTAERVEMAKELRDAADTELRHNAEMRVLLRQAATMLEDLLHSNPLKCG